MKNYLAFLTFICFALLSRAQVKHVNPYRDLENIDRVLTFESLHVSLMGITTTLHGSASQTTSKNEITIFTDSLNKSSPSNKDLAFYKKYKNSIVEYLNGLYNFGNTAATFSEDKFSFSFAKNKNKLVFIQSGIYAGYNLNSLKMDADQRCLYIVKNVIVASLANFEPLTKNPEIQFYAMIVGYGAKDFSDDGSQVQGELICALIPKSMLLLYIHSKITDKTLFANSVFYNKSANSENVRLISF